jgi:hypothetical protein
MKSFDGVVYLKYIRWFFLLSPRFSARVIESVIFFCVKNVINPCFYAFVQSSLVVLMSFGFFKSEF